MSDDHIGSVSEFKTLLADQGIDPQRRSKLGLSRVPVEPKPKFLSELNLSTKFPEGGVPPRNKSSAGGGTRGNNAITKLTEKKKKKNGGDDVS
jgi:hypothetical protein